MVLQQKQSNPIWGWDTPGTKVTVTFAGQTKSAEAAADGKWTVKLDPVPVNAQPQTIKIAGTNTVEIQDVLGGEVWMCSGQSNMGFTLNQDWNGDHETEAASGRNPPLSNRADQGRGLSAASVGKFAGTFCVTLPVAAHSVPRCSVVAKPTSLIASRPCPSAVWKTRPLP